MKRFICLLIILVFIPLLSFAQSSYTPALGMTLNDFITKYNSLGSSLNSPLLPLSKHYQVTRYEENNVYWYKVDKKTGVFILLLSADPASNAISTDCGLDHVQIFLDNEKDFLSMISVATRCTNIFSSDFFGTSLAPLYLNQVMTAFYENNSKDLGMYNYQQINTDYNYTISFAYDEMYYFSIDAGGIQ